MEKSKDSLNYNRAANLICDINLDINIFLDKLSNFRTNFNITDNNMLNNLEMVLEEINNFFEGNPANVKTEDRTAVDLDTLKQNGIVGVYVCETCHIELGDRSREILRHIQHCQSHIKSKVAIPPCNDKKSNSETEKEKKKAKREKKSNLTRPFPKKAKTLISSDLGIFFDQASELGKKLLEIPEYKIIETSLYDTLRTDFPDLKIYFFGSRMNGLSNKNSDLDIFLDVNNMYHQYKKGNETPTLIKVERLLRKKSKDWKMVLSIAKARIPILKADFSNGMFKMSCDISFSNGLGHLNTLLVKYIFELQPISQKMCLFLKEWIKKTDIANIVSSYTYVLFVIFFLQTKKLLPPIKNLQDEIENPVTIGPWQGDFIEKSLSELNIEEVEPTNLNCLVNLKQFFKFYYEFDFQNLIICPYLGRPVSKVDFHSSELGNFPRYETYYMKNKTENAFQLQKPVCTMDPLELNINITKAVSELNLKTSKGFWKITYDYFADRS